MPTEAEIYAEFLRELSMLSSTEELDVDELRGAADFIMSQQAVIDGHGIESHMLSYDANYLHSGGG